MGFFFFVEYVIVLVFIVFILINKENFIFKYYSISLKVYRWFCLNCGLFFYWQLFDNEKDYICLVVGSIDQVYFVGGENDEGVLKEGYGLVFVGGGGEYFFCQNEIKGVMDDILLLGRKRGMRVMDGGELVQRDIFYLDVCIVVIFYVV